MKRRMLFISLVLVLILTALMPAAALAKDKAWQQGPASTDFSGSGTVFITYFPDPIIKGNVWRYQDEIVEGFLDQCDWDLLAGTVFWSEHDSVVHVDELGNASGVMKGTFTLTRPDGSGTLEGTFIGKITGNLVSGIISDTGTWKSTGGNDVFEDVKAWGKWSADLSPGLIPGTDLVSLVGPVTWEGKYIAPKPVIKPWKPLEPGNAIKPGKPIKPWKPIKP